jgi:hydrogenase assembly chaperone HypC/HupF
MCVSIPGRVVEVQGAMAQVENVGGRRWYSALARPEVCAGDWVYTHAHLIIAIVSAEEAAATIAAAEELDALLREQEVFRFGEQVPGPVEA